VTRDDGGAATPLSPSSGGGGGRRSWNEERIALSVAVAVDDGSLLTSTDPDCLLDAFSLADFRLYTRAEKPHNHPAFKLHN